MTFLWIAIGGLLLIVVLITLVDVIRRGGPFLGIVGWAALVVFLPFLGSLIYWALRKPNQDELEHERLAQEDIRRTAADRPIDTTRIG
jgi:hypothetical protein